MKPYVHDPALFRRHFSGQGLPGFKGKRLQRGGSLGGLAATALTRYAVPLLMAGATAAAPQIGKAVGHLAQSAARRILPNNKAMQQVAAKAATRAANHATTKALGAARKQATKTKKKHKTNSKRTTGNSHASAKGRTASTLESIFS